MCCLAAGGGTQKGHWGGNKPSESLARLVYFGTELRLRRGPLAPNAVGKGGCILLNLVGKDSWFTPVGVLDPVQGNLSGSRSTVPLTSAYQGGHRTAE